MQEDFWMLNNAYTYICNYNNINWFFNAKQHLNLTLLSVRWNVICCKGCRSYQHNPRWVWTSGLSGISTYFNKCSEEQHYTVISFDETDIMKAGQSRLMRPHCVYFQQYTFLEHPVFHDFFIYHIRFNRSREIISSAAVILAAFCRQK